MRCVTKENTIDRPSLELVQLLPFLKDKALATKDMKVTRLGCATVHQLLIGFLLVDSEVHPIQNKAHGVDHLSPEPSRSPMLIEHRPSHLTQGSVFPFHHTILGRRIRTRKLMFNTQVMVKGFEARVFKFRAIVTGDRSYGIFVPLVAQPQDKISNKTKRLPFLLKKKHPRIPRVVVHHNKDIPLPTRRSHTSWDNKVHMEQLAWTLIHHIIERWVRKSYHLGMPTWHTNELILKLQHWQSSDQIEFTQVRQKVKSQVTQLPMPLLQLTRTTSQETTLHSRRLRKISSEHLTLGNDHANKAPLRI
jgi:hypothetical protein